MPLSTEAGSRFEGKTTQAHMLQLCITTGVLLQELTFRQKLEEVKRLRNSGQSANTGADAPRPVQQQAKPKVLINGKEALAMHGDWALMESSSGRKYFFNVKTMVNQWTK